MLFQLSQWLWALSQLLVWWQGHLQSAKSNDVGAFTVVGWNSDLVEELGPLDHISVKVLRPVITGPRVSRMVCSSIWQTFFFFFLPDVDFSLACIITTEGLLSGFIMGYGINSIIISRFDFNLLSKCGLCLFCFLMSHLGSLHYLWEWSGKINFNFLERIRGRTWINYPHSKIWILRKIFLGSGSLVLNESHIRWCYKFVKLTPVK